MGDAFDHKHEPPEKGVREIARSRFEGWTSADFERELKRVEGQRRHLEEVIGNMNRLQCEREDRQYARLLELVHSVVNYATRCGLECQEVWLGPEERHILLRGHTLSGGAEPGPAGTIVGMTVREMATPGIRVGITVGPGETIQ